MSRRAKGAESRTEKLQVIVRSADSAIRTEYEDTLSPSKRRDLILEEFAAIAQDLMDSSGRHSGAVQEEQEILPQNP